MELGKEAHSKTYVNANDIKRNETKRNETI